MFAAQAVASVRRLPPGSSPHSCSCRSSRTSAFPRCLRRWRRARGPFLRWHPTGPLGHGQGGSAWCAGARCCSAWARGWRARKSRGAPGDELSEVLGLGAPANVLARALGDLAIELAYRVGIGAPRRRARPPHRPIRARWACGDGARAERPAGRRPRPQSRTARRPARPRTLAPPRASRSNTSAWRRGAGSARAAASGGARTHCCGSNAECASGSSATCMYALSSGSLALPLALRLRRGRAPRDAEAEHVNAAERELWRARSRVAARAWDAGSDPRVLVDQGLRDSAPGLCRPRAGCSDPRSMPGP